VEVDADVEAGLGRDIWLEVMLGMIGKVPVGLIARDGEASGKPTVLEAVILMLVNWSDGRATGTGGVNEVHDRQVNMRVNPIRASDHPSGCLKPHPINGFLHGFITLLYARFLDLRNLHMISGTQHYYRESRISWQVTLK